MESLAVPGVRSRILPLIVSAAVLALLGILTYAIASPRAASELGVGGRVNTAGKLIRFEGRLAPGFTLTTFDGRPMSLAAYRGRTVVLNFWASWCPPCREEAPVLRQFAARHAGGSVVLLGVDVWDKEPDARAFLAEFGLSYPNALDRDGLVSIEYGVSGVPETYVIGPDGRLLGKYTGPVESVEQLEAIVRELGGGS
ncbi:Thiol-disulfide oxidoreductase ResA [bacterium HR26]|nr:Thiol-disulfide oxidoreductase ResA [bacterium HR26]